MELTNIATNKRPEWTDTGPGLLEYDQLARIRPETPPAVTQRSWNSEQ